MIENNGEKKAVAKTFLLGLLIVMVSAALGIFAYTTFIKDNNKVSNEQNNSEQNNQNVTSEYTEYKTSDNKYIIKLKDNEVYLNDTKIEEYSNRINGNKFIQIYGDFSPSTNYITGLTFILDKENKTIVEQDIREIGQEDIDAFGEYARFSARTGLTLYTVNNWDFMTFESEGPTDVYTTTWKKLGYFVNSDIDYDNSGIYVCTNYDDNFNCIHESKYDVNGNKID